MEIFEIVVVLLDALLEELVLKLLGLIGWLVASILTFGRWTWNDDDRQSIISGFITVVVVLVVTFRAITFTPDAPPSAMLSPTGIEPVFRV